MLRRQQDKRWMELQSLCKWCRLQHLQQKLQQLQFQLLKVWRAHLGVQETRKLGVVCCQSLQALTLDRERMRLQSGATGVGRLNNMLGLWIPALWQRSTGLKRHLTLRWTWASWRAMSRSVASFIQFACVCSQESTTDAFEVCEGFQRLWVLQRATQRSKLDQLTYNDVGQDHLRGLWELSDASVKPFHP